MINYREDSEGLMEAWFKYKKTKPNMELSLVDFAAGYNAAIHFLYKKNIDKK